MYTQQFYLTNCIPGMVFVCLFFCVFFTNMPTEIKVTNVCSVQISGVCLFFVCAHGQTISPFIAVHYAQVAHK